jgi:HAD superfamily hydrolase (TIGR01509 family)
VYELLILDCDGVLVDSEIISIRVEAQLLARAGFEISEQMIVERYVGLNAASIRKRIEAEFGRPLPDGFEEHLQAEVLRAFESDLRAIPGVGKALAELSGPRCVASSSDVARIHKSLELCNLTDLLAPHIFSAQMVERGKPAPDLFEHAAREMGVRTRDCIVIEDSCPGVEAARTAGMRTLGFTGGGHCTPSHARNLEAAGATRCFDRMSDLPALLADL